MVVALMVPMFELLMFAMMPQMKALPPIEGIAADDESIAADDEGIAIDDEGIATNESIAADEACRNVRGMSTVHSVRSPECTAVAVCGSYYQRRWQ